MKQRRVKTNKKDFEIFVTECRKWVKELELNRWDIIYTHKSSKGQNQWCQAGNQIYKDSHAEIFFDTDWDMEEITSENIKNAAKHEILHILLGGIANQAYKRFASEDALSVAEEEVIRILCKKLK